MSRRRLQLMLFNKVRFHWVYHLQESSTYAVILKPNSPRLENLQEAIFKHASKLKKKTKADGE